MVVKKDSSINFRCSLKDKQDIEKFARLRGLALDEAFIELIDFARVFRSAYDSASQKSLHYGDEALAGHLTTEQFDLYSKLAYRDAFDYIIAYSRRLDL